WLGRFPLAFAISISAGLAINAAATSELGAQIKFSMHSLDAEKVDLNHADAHELGKVPGVTPVIAKKLAEEARRRPFTSVGDALARPSLSAAERSDLDEKRGPLVGIDARASVRAGDKDWFGILSNVLLLAGLLSSLLYFYFSLAHKGPIGRVSRFGVWVLMIGFGASVGYTVQVRIARDRPCPRNRGQEGIARRRGPHARAVGGAGERDHHRRRDRGVGAARAAQERGTGAWRTGRRRDKVAPCTSWNLAGATSTAAAST